MCCWALLHWTFAQYESSWTTLSYNTPLPGKNKRKWSVQAAHCVAPPASDVEAEGHVIVRFDADGGRSAHDEPAYDLRGSAAVRPDGSLSLTRSDYHLVGTLLVRAPKAMARAAFSFATSSPRSARPARPPSAPVERPPTHSPPIQT